MTVAVVVLVAAPASATSVNVATETEYRTALTSLSADTSGPHTINLTGDITLTGGTDPTYSGSTPLTIAGAGHIIDATTTSRVLKSDGIAGLTLDHVTIRHGAAAAGNGGGVLSGGPVTLTAAVVTDNTAAAGLGGGVYSPAPVTARNSTVGNNLATWGGGLYSTATVLVTDSTFSQNTSTAPAGGGGGAYATGSVTVTNSTFDRNRTYTGSPFLGSGGGVSGGAPVTVTGSTFVGNGADSAGGVEGRGPINVINSTFQDNSGHDGFGGGVANYGGPITVTSSVFDGNTAGFDGGGVHSVGPVTVTDSLFTSNRSTDDGGAVRVRYPDSHVTVTGSTFVDNTSATGGGGLNSDSSVSVSNSTFTTNSDGTAGGGIYSLGDVQLVHATITGNSAPDGGNLYIDSDLSPVASVLASPAGGSGNCDIGGSAIDPSYNWADDTSCGLTGTGDTQDIGGNPLLGPFQDNGGPTPTMSPQLGSTLRDAVPLAACTDAVDQRGASRPSGPGCDIGAVEADETDPTVDLRTPPDGATYAQHEVVTADFSCADAPVGSGIATCVGTTANRSPMNTSTLGDHDFTVTATDNAGNQHLVTHTYTVVDVTDPIVDLRTPPDGAVYDRDQTVTADFSCADEPDGSGIATCDGNVADGAPVNTSTSGSHDVTVTATDVAGNTSEVLHTYTVTDVIVPTVDLRTPPDGATYDRNEVIAADFSCTDDAGGSGINTCDGNVPDGSPIDTSTLGDHTFTVTATDTAGNTNEVTHTYTVADPQPDGRIRRGATGRYVGDNLYNTTGDGQTRTGSAARGATVTYFVSVQNDALFADELRLRGTATTSRFRVLYFTGGFDITSQVTDGTYTTPTLAPGAAVVVKVEVKVKSSAPAGSAVSATVTTRSTSDPTRQDKVKFVTSRR